MVGSGLGSPGDCESDVRDFIAAHQLHETVSLPGKVDNVHEYLQAADVFVFPSEYESFGISIIEGLSCALPIVTTKVGVANDHIEDRVNGVLTSPKNPRELEEALEWVLDNRQYWPALGQNGRKGVVEKYALPAVSEKYHRMLVELMPRLSDRSSSYTRENQPRT